MSEIFSDWLGFVGRCHPLLLHLPIGFITVLAVIEAMAYGCIPILSDIPANHEWVIDRINGIIYRKQDFNLTMFQKILSSKEIIARKNREIVKERGFFPDLMKHFVEKIKQI